MKKNIILTRHVTQKGEYHYESVLVTAFPLSRVPPFLEISCFGRSLFKRGGVFPIVTNTWTLQIQTEGQAKIESECESFIMKPFDMLLAPPNVKYRYTVPKTADMRKDFMILRPGPLPEYLLGDEGRGNVTRIVNADKRFADHFERIRSVFSALTMPDMETLSLEIYSLLFNIGRLRAVRGRRGDFAAKLAEAAQNPADISSLDILAKKFGLGKHSLIRAFKRETGEPPVKYMIGLRLKQAEQLLALSSMPVSEVASACGYSSPSFFAAEFKKRFGIAPGESRARAHRKNE